MQNPDDALGIRFYMKPVLNKAKSQDEGRPIYEDREMVSIVFPADPRREIVAPAHEMHMNPNVKEQMTYAERFPKFYEAFKAGQEDFVSGTPIALLPGITEARKAEFEHLKIRTIEQLAGMPATSVKRLGMGALALQQEAKDYLDKASGLAEVDALRAELAELKAQVSGKQVADVQEADPFDGLEVDDLANLIRDGGGNVPPGRPSRKSYVAELRRMAEEKEAA